MVMILNTAQFREILKPPPRTPYDARQTRRTFDYLSASGGSMTKSVSRSLGGFHLVNMGAEEIGSSFVCAEVQSSIDMSNGRRGNNREQTSL